MIDMPNPRESYDEIPKRDPLTERIYINFFVIIFIVKLWSHELGCTCRSPILMAVITATLQLRGICNLPKQVIAAAVMTLASSPLRTPFCIALSSDIRVDKPKSPDKFTDVNNNRFTEPFEPITDANIPSRPVNEYVITLDIAMDNMFTV
jgi:hypothetical protein